MENVIVYNDIENVVVDNSSVEVEVYNDEEAIVIVNETEVIVVDSPVVIAGVQDFLWSVTGHCDGEVELPMLTLLGDARPHGRADLELPMFTVESISLVHGSSDLTLPSLVAVGEAFTIHADSDITLPVIECTGYGDPDVSITADGDATLSVITCQVEALSILADSDLALPSVSCTAEALSVLADSALVLSLPVCESASSASPFCSADIVLPSTGVVANTGGVAEIELCSLTAVGTASVGGDKLYDHVMWSYGRVKKDIELTDNAWSYGKSRMLHLAEYNKVEVTLPVITAEGTSTATTAVIVLPMLTINALGGAFADISLPSITIDAIAIGPTFADITLPKVVGEGTAYSIKADADITLVSLAGTGTTTIANAADITLPGLGIVAGNWLEGYDQRIKLTLSSAQVDAALSNFPVPIYLSASSGITNADVSCVFDELTNDANRKKIAITLADKMTQCYVEIERWDDANEKAWLHVKVPSISASTNTDLYLYYDYNAANNNDYVGDVGWVSATKVWDSNFKAVYHLGEDPTGGTGCIKDSTSNANHGTPGGSMTAGDLVDGQFGKCLEFDGTDDIVNCGSGSSLDDISTKTIEVAIDDPAITTGRLVHKYSSSVGWTFYVTGPSSPRVRLFQTFSGTDGGWMITHTLGAHHLAVTHDSSSTSNNPLLYSDGVSQAVTEWIVPTGTVDSEAANNLTIGNDDNTYPYAGKIDEVRISNVIRTAAWIKATYKGLWDNLITFGSEETR